MRRSAEAASVLVSADSQTLRPKPSDRRATESRRISRELLRALHDVSGMKLVRIAEDVIFSLNETLKSRFGVGHIQLRVLVIVGLHQPISLTAVARQSRMDKAWISRTIQGLVGRGLLARTKHPTDRRGSLLALSPAGEELLCDMAAVTLHHQEQLLKGLRKRQVKQILDILMIRAEEMLRTASHHSMA
jgi:DNA-binding MarR family transcriptional regulator